jgi:hypothetical protein
MADFENQAVLIALVDRDEGAIRDKTFDGCEINGPAVVAPTDCNFDGCTFNGDPEALMWEVPQGTRRIGLVGLVRCQFRNCTFTDIGMAGTPKTIADFRKALS